MKISLKQCYKVVLADLKSEYTPCKDYATGCPNCALGRLIQDLESYFAFFVSEIK